MNIYDKTFKQRAIDYLKETGDAEQVIKAFGISQSTLWRWKKEGARDPQYKGNKNALKLDEEALLAYVEKHPDALLKELAEIFHSSTSGISSALKRLGITRKKKPKSTKKPININAHSSKRK